MADKSSRCDILLARDFFDFHPFWQPGDPGIKMRISYLFNSKYFIFLYTVHVPGFHFCEKKPSLEWQFRKNRADLALKIVHHPHGPTLSTWTVTASYSAPTLVFFTYLFFSFFS
jgi:hypothetical protein